MLRRLRSSLTYANVMSTLGVFLVVSGGTAWAVNEWTGANIVDDSLTGADIQNQSLTLSDYAIGSVWGSRIKDDGVFTNHIANNSLTGNDIDESTLNNAGVQAPAQTTGPVSSGADNVFVPIPLAFGSWTQLSGELDLMHAEVTIDAPPTCMSGGGDGTTEIKIFLDGTEVGGFFRSISQGDGTTKNILPAIQPPNASTPHTVTAQVMDTCDGAENWSVTSLKVTVAGIR